MQKATLTAVALALTVTAGAAQAGGYYLPFNSIQGIGDVHLPSVHVHPHVIKVDPHLDIENAVEFGQYNTGDMTSIQGFVSKGPKKVTGTSAAIGNTANVDVTGGVIVEGNQKNYGVARAAQGALVLGAKKVELTTAALGNVTNVASKGDAVVDLKQYNFSRSVKSKQISGIFTPYGYDLGPVEVTSAAIGNSLSVEFGPKSEALVSALQGNKADAIAVNLTAIGGKFKSAEITSAAIGNALNVTNVLD